MAVLWTTDFLMFTLAVESIMTTGVGGIVLFASEVNISMSTSVTLFSADPKLVCHPSYFPDELGRKILHLYN